MKYQIGYRRAVNKMKSILLYQKQLIAYKIRKGRLVKGSKKYAIVFIGRVYGAKTPEDVFAVANWAERGSKLYGNTRIMPYKTSYGSAGSNICFVLNGKGYVCEPIGWKITKSLKQAKEYLLNREYQLI